MSYTNEATSVPEQGTVINATEQLVTDEPLINPSTDDDSVVFVADGEYEDPRVVVIGKNVEDYGAQVNGVGKLQRSIKILLTDGTAMIVSGFGAKTKKLDGVKLGGTYSFRGKLKTKTETFQGKEKTSRFLNL